MAADAVLDRIQNALSTQAVGEVSRQSPRAISGAGDESKVAAQASRDARPFDVNSEQGQEARKRCSPMS